MSVEVIERLARMEEKLDHAKEQRAELGTKLDAIEGRLRKVEGWRAYTVGFAAAVSAAVSYIIPHR